MARYSSHGETKQNSRDVENFKESMKSTAKTMISNIRNSVFCASINKGEIMIACGLGVLENGKIG